MRSDLVSSAPPLARQIVTWWRAPPRPALVALAAAVLLAHALVLQTQPARIGPESAAQRPPAFVTRSIAPAPPQSPPTPDVAAPPVEARAKPAVKPVKKPFLKPKRPVAQAAPAQPAIDSIAEPVLETVTAEVSPAAAEVDSAPSPAASETAPAPSAEIGSQAAPTPPTPPASAASAPLPPPPPPPPPPPLATPPPSQTPVTAMALPTSARLDYKMTGRSKGLTYYANGELAWQNTGTDYQASMTVKALFIGSRSMSSTGRISSEGLAPSRFSDKSRSEVAAHFEPDKGLISFSANTPSVAWLKGAQDRVSVVLQLGGMLAGKPEAFPVGATISTLTVGPRDAENWTFVVESQEMIGLPFGELASIKLSRQPRREFDQKVEIWYAPALGYLPVRNKITQANGDFVDQQLSALTRP
ncbi:MAG: DUF3108 domain-containing protein [Polaromonas sp.]